MYSSWGLNWIDDSFPGKDVKATLDDFNSEKSYSAFPAHMNTVVGNEALIKYVADGDAELNVYGLNPVKLYLLIGDD